jgi:hypothetical protein
VTLRDCVLVDNQGDAPSVTAVGAARLTVERSAIVNAHGPAVQLEGLGGSGPEVTVERSVVGELSLRSQAPAKLRVAHSALTHALPAEATDGGGNRVGEVTLDPDGRPPPGSPAEGRGPAR